MFSSGMVAAGYLGGPNTLSCGDMMIKRDQKGLNGNMLRRLSTVSFFVCPAAFFTFIALFLQFPRLQNKAPHCKPAAVLLPTTTRAAAAAVASTVAADMHSSSLPGA
jgi:hypothetical protein